MRRPALPSPATALFARKKLSRIRIAFLCLPVILSLSRLRQPPLLSIRSVANDEIRVVTMPAVTISWRSGCPPPQYTLRKLPIPEPVLYRLFLNHVASFAKSAKIRAARGLDPNPLRQYFLRKIGLTQEQNDTLNEVALDYDRQDEPIRSRAAAVAKAFRRARFPAGRLADGDAPPPPPIELKSLSERHRSVTLAARERLAHGLGKEAFQRLDRFLKEQFPTNITVQASLLDGRRGTIQ